MIYVEGEDDISFWNELFRKELSENLYELEQVNGKSNLLRFMNGLEDGSIKNTIVACDLDYNIYLEHEYTNPFILFTYGHSIENSMFCPAHIIDYTRRLSSSKDDNSVLVNEWINTFCSTAVILLPYEIISIKNNLKIKCFNNMLYNFLHKEKFELDNQKIEKFINDIQHIFKMSDITKISDKINNDQRENRYKIQGHFFAQAVMKFIRDFTNKRQKKISLSNDAIYGEFVSCNNYCGSICIEKTYIKTKIKAAIEALGTS